jgi:hypothetical protein
VTCDQCPLSFTCLYGEVTPDVSVCLHCGYAHVNYGHLVFKCADPARLDEACKAHRWNVRECFLCKRGAHTVSRQGIAIIKTVYFDLDDNDLHSA